MAVSIIATVIIAGFIIQHLLRLKEKRDEIKTHEEKVPQQENGQTVPDTQGLMFQTLTNIGCQPVKNDDDGTISVSYQGENFRIEFSGMYAMVWDPMWSGIKAFDPDLPKIREAVNITNFNFGPTVVMTAPNKDGFIGFHSHYDIMLHPACPDNDQYVRAVLDSFFETKEEVSRNFQKINTRQEESQKQPSPSAFTPGSLN